MTAPIDCDTTRSRKKMAVILSERSEPKDLHLLFAALKGHDC
jgi:hypothetical protein